MWIKPTGFLLVLGLSLVAATVVQAAPAGKTPSFADFDKRAKNGERLSVVFFGASLTWGANASDPTLTSYRNGVADKMEAAYPKAHFKFWNAAIGGTGSQLGTFRVERDVLSRKPDLVFLDFSANDDIYDGDVEKHASYEALVRRLIRDGGCPVVQVIFPFKWNVKEGEMAKMKRRDAHLTISKAYNTGVGDAIALANERVARGETTVDELWPYDGAHPCDKGYALFADAAWKGFQDAVGAKKLCAAPQKMLFADTYMTYNRARLATLGAAPTGWKVGTPNLVSAYFDMLMSRWQDQQWIAQRPAAGEETARLKLRFQGNMAMLFGEGTTKSGHYHLYLDGKMLEYKAGKDQMSSEYDAGKVARPSNGNTHHVQMVATGLDPAVWHTLEIEPLWKDETEKELRFESLCVAGGPAKVELVP